MSDRPAERAGRRRLSPILVPPLVAISTGTAGLPVELPVNGLA